MHGFILNCTSYHAKNLEGLFSIFTIKTDNYLLDWFLKYTWKEALKHRFSSVPTKENNAIFEGFL